MRASSSAAARCWARAGCADARRVGGGLGGVAQLVVDVVLVEIAGASRRVAGASTVPRSPRTAAAARACPACGRTPRTLDSRRFWRFTKTRRSLPRPGAISAVYSASMRASSSSGASGEVISSETTCRSGKRLATPSARRSDLRRRTMIGSSCAAAGRHAAREALADRAAPAGRRSCWSGRCAAWPTGTGGSRTRREVADHARGVGVDGVLAARGRRGGVGLVEDEQRCGAAPSGEHLVQRLAVLGAAQRLVRDDEARVRDPRVDAEAALLAPPLDEGAVVQLEAQAEALLHLALPLRAHRGRRDDEDACRPGCAAGAPA